MTIPQINIYQAPLQGFTDFVYRRAYAESFHGVSKFFTPYIHYDKNNELSKKFIRDVAKENNPQKIVVPQVLTNSSSELIGLSEYLEGLMYNEVNLNMGCPYPMVALKGKGSGQLKDHEAFRDLMESYFAQNRLPLSLKLRLGYENDDDVFKILEVSNDFPLTEIIIHPRIGKQLYKGEPSLDRFEECLGKTNHKIVYNGDINSIEDYHEFQQRFSKIENIMVGRGMLMNPFLPEEIMSGIETNHGRKQHQLIGFHEAIFKLYETETDPTNLLNKMQQFWIYFSWQFKDQRKALKKIKKLNSIIRYSEAVNENFVMYI